MDVRYLSQLVIKLKGQPPYRYSERRQYRIYLHKPSGTMDLLGSQKHSFPSFFLRKMAFENAGKFNRCAKINNEETFNPRLFGFTQRK